MRTETEWLEHLKKQFRSREFATAQDLEMIEKAIEQHPTSSALWQHRAHLIQLSDDDDHYTLGDALASYQKAVELCPDNPELYEDLGHYYDAIENNQVTAEGYFRTAVELGGGKSAKESLEQVMAEIHETRIKQESDDAG